MTDPAKFILKWERKRRLGPLKHILKYSVVIPVGALIGGTIGTITGQGNVNKFLANSLFGVIFLLFLGSGLGLFDWKRNERKYKYLIGIDN